MRDLLRLAADAGLTVHACRLPDGMLGCYEPDRARIWFDIRLTPAERRSVIAHELGHHHYGHRGSTPAAERRADRYAAVLLVDPEEYARIERVHPDVHTIADELQVTVKIVEAFRDQCLERRGDATVVRRFSA
ncbi:ImmA/IrrE family metallo-endopeptidase [Protaetiibacter mangrovi]|uniref:ImmA/IrrE family metallo-endopeptidase n=1 Tax=Protaetiibacter mangrovi TaxID=2970926 RepID=A0ABT1ZIU8_9MICO|nr:ImmA/IrrE family metallo-endopeptidase [Protaetiibacter mangrovi]MCS0500607.1 ImmA/IrrE family metallo-endopeptidase [Protaetiibacter mangrovi]